MFIWRKMRVNILERAFGFTSVCVALPMPFCNRSPIPTLVIEDNARKSSPALNEFNRRAGLSAAYFQNCWLNNEPSLVATCKKQKAKQNKRIRAEGTELVKKIRTEMAEGGTTKVHCGHFRIA